MTKDGAHMVKWVKLTSDMTPARPETATRFRKAAQAMKRAAVWLGEKLVLVRIQWSHQVASEWTVTTAAMASAVAGARTSSATMLWCAGGLDDGGVWVSGNVLST